MIVKVQNVCGGKACVANTRIPVFVIARLIREGASLRKVIQSYPTMTNTDVVDCAVYADNNREEIAADDATNEAD